MLRKTACEDVDGLGDEVAAGVVAGAGTGRLGVFAAAGVALGVTAGVAVGVLGAVVTPGEPV